MIVGLSPTLRGLSVSQSSADMSLASEVREGERWLLQPKRYLLKKGWQQEQL